MLDPGTYTIEHSAPSLFGSATAAELMNEDLPPIRYVVPGYIVEGLTLLGGKPKLGKSWLLLGVAIAVATGGYALGSIQVEDGDVLYLALEDNKRRLQKRLNQLLPTGNRPKRLHYELSYRQLDVGLLEDLRDWINRVPNPGLIIDVPNEVRPRAAHRQILGQRLPLAAGPEHVEDGVEQLTDVHHRRLSSTFSGADQRLNQRLLGIGQVTVVAQTPPIRCPAMLRRPHAAPHSKSGARQGSITVSPDSTSFRKGSNV